MIIGSSAMDQCTSILRQRERQRLAVLQAELDSIEAENPGSLHWRRRGDSFNFWEYSSGRQIGITRNQSRIYLLARLAYLRLRLDDMRIWDYPGWTESMDALLQTFETLGLELPKIIFTKAQYNWAAHPQSQNTNRTKDLIYKTGNGVKVRSKSERFIGNVLESMGIPYRYEPELRIGNRVFHPDFVIMTTDGRKIILEHLGRMDLRDYINDNIDRLSAYASHGLLIGRDVFLSFEADVRSREAFMPIIHQLMAA
ncbi:MAG: hypothetical protein MJ161_03690 [Clostridia bacterium]|nr:hypothetical protein [Clostridia bacterium]